MLLGVVGGFLLKMLTGAHMIVDWNCYRNKCCMYTLLHEQSIRRVAHEFGKGMFGGFGGYLRLLRVICDRYFGAVLEGFRGNNYYRSDPRKEHNNPFSII